MSKDLSTFWLDETVEKISRRKPQKITLSTGKTPSGHIHIGILRELIICDALRRVFEDKGNDVNFYLFIDDFDAAKRFPDYIEKEFQKEHLGKPFALIPCPFKECGCESYAAHFGNELISTFPDFGIENNIIWTFKLYQEKRMQDKVKIALDNTDLIKNILKKYILPTLDNKRKQEFIAMQKTWMPVMVLCENCSKLQKRSIDGSIIPNRVLSYFKEKEEVTYECPACNHKGKVSIYSGRLKLNWRIDWPAKWTIFNTTCEPAGKDHSVKGGAYDTGLEICKKIFDYEGPITLPYEWLRLGEQDMKTSKGIVFTPKRYLKLADPEIYRMLILRTNPMKHISLRIEEIPQYHDYYDNMEDIYYKDKEAESKQELEFFLYLYPLTKINGVPETKPIKIPFKFLIFLAQIQNLLSIEKLYEKAIQVIDCKEQDLTFEEFKFILKRTDNWLMEVKKIIENIKDVKRKNYILNKIDIFTIPEKLDKSVIDKLDKAQIKGISLFSEFIMHNITLEPDIIQNKVFTIAKEELEIPPKKLFEALYIIILGKKSGPRLGPFITMLDEGWLLKRLSQVLD
ncbi:MAG: lysine--tRNA ligase [Candidatus Hermodarchaeota archaeon]